jgi:hypothetical protein
MCVPGMTHEQLRNREKKSQNIILNVSLLQGKSEMYRVSALLACLASASAFAPSTFLPKTSNRGTPCSNMASMLFSQPLASCC